MKFLPIVFLLAVVCLAVAAAQEAPNPKPKPPRPPTTTSTTTSTVRKTTTPVTTTTVRPIKTRKPKKTTATTTTTSQPTTTTTATTSPRRTTTVNPATTTTTAPRRTVTCTAVALTEISESPCGTCTLLTPTSGTIQSLNFPNDYGVYNSSDTFINSLYKIKAPPRRKIQLTFTTFVVEQKFDLINVYDGIFPSGTILAANLTGYSLPPAPYTTVETNQMSVVFDTDRNNAGLPFRLRPAKWQATFKVVL
ncbi:cell wall protein DAN4-like isoform X1 [Daphnia pulicaria]|uniref:cell wall protein DAN4-like isoform X1 n=1 Tax=Daphnia pulicaria TaxID=35523 RepID=UPI001EEBBB6B|nr:cell wall protein DAN4-like isoform X1 [Daphnia pulicaria]XP_046655427.1 cell wall protein DAN4-like isoform X1 [Daphnia pulicaria]